MSAICAWSNGTTRAIGEQLRGLLFKDGGPVIGVQLENEYMHTGAPWEVVNPAASVEWVPAGQDGADHLRRLKQLALAAGLDVPIYTATAWGGAPIIDGETPARVWRLCLSRLD